MKDDRWFYDLIEERKDDPDFVAEEVVLDITEQISRRLKQLGLRPTDLAQRLGVSRAAVSQLLNGKPNMTIRTLVGVALALNQQVHVELRPQLASDHVQATYSKRVRVLLPESQNALFLAA